MSTKISIAKKLLGDDAYQARTRLSRERLCRSQDDASWERMDATVSEVNFMPLDFGVREP